MIIGCIIMIDVEHISVHIILPFLIYPTFLEGVAIWGGGMLVIGWYLQYSYIMRFLYFLYLAMVSWAGAIFNGKSLLILF